VSVAEVSDSGPGLPPEQAAHVFERFWRADKARSRAKGGSGLGMAIVAQIVQAHGGTVRFDSSVERGTTVTVTVPATAEPADETGYPPAPQHPADQYPVDHYPAGGLPPEAPVPPPVPAGRPGWGQAGQPPG